MPRPALKSWRDLGEGKAHKYGAERTLGFDSKKEAARFQELTLLLKAGEICDLKVQPKFALDVNGIHICNYIADFQYTDKKGRVVIEDVKGVKTAVYRIKSKLLKATWAGFVFVES